MKKIIACTITGFLMFSGCQKKSDTGGGAGEKEHFQLEVPRTATSVSQDHKAEVAIGIKRGKDFKEPIDLKFEVPKGIKVTTDTKTVEKDVDKVKATVDVGKDVPPDTYTVKVIGKPAKGDVTSAKFDVKVVKE